MKLPQDLRPALERLHGTLQEAARTADEKERQRLEQRAQDWKALIRDLALGKRDTRPRDDDQRKRIAAAAAAGSPEDAAASVLDILGVRIRSLVDFNQSMPEPIVWRDPDDEEKGSQIDSLVSRGQVALLSGAGGDGKSSVTLSLAVAAANAFAQGVPYGTACGLRVRAGRTVIVSYEDPPVIMRHRVGGLVHRGVLVWDDPDPLWQLLADKSAIAGPSWAWDVFWGQLSRLEPSLIIIDPVSAALSGVSTIETGPIRSFVTAMGRRAQEIGAAVLMVAHANKAARNETHPGPGAVAGSAAWYDTSRGVLYLRRDRAEHAVRILSCIKSNYGRSGWGMRLREQYGESGIYKGLKVTSRFLYPEGRGRAPAKAGGKDAAAP